MKSVVGLHVRRLVLPVYLPMVLLSVGVAAPVAAFPQYLSSLGATLAVVGVVVSLQGIGNLIIDVPGGLILARFPVRRVMFVCVAAATAASSAIALTRDVFTIGALTLVGAAARSVIITAMMTYVRLTVPPGSRGRALSFVGGSLRLGLLVGPAMGGIISDRLGVPFAFGLQALSSAAAALLLVASPDRAVAAVSTERNTSMREQTRDLASGMRGRWFAFITVGSSIVVLQLLRAARSVILPLWGDHIGLSITVIGAVMSAGAVTDLLLFVPAGQIMDRAGRKVAGSICIGLFAVGIAALPFTSGIGGFVAVSMVIGLGNGFGAGINMTLGTDLAPDRAVSTFLGVWRLFGDIGSSAGPAIVGAVAAAAGLSVSLLVTAAVGGVGLLVMAVLAPETLRFAPRRS
jgi:MFS family permease